MPRDLASIASRALHPAATALLLLVLGGCAHGGGSAEMAAPDVGVGTDVALERPEPMPAPVPSPPLDRPGAPEAGPPGTEVHEPPPRPAPEAPAELSPREAALALQRALASGDASAVLLALRAASPDARLPNGRTPLEMALERGDNAILGALLAAGANPNAKLSGGELPLTLAAARGNADAVDQLIRAGADVDAVDANGATALELAIRGRHAAVIERLAQAGAQFPEVAAPAPPTTEPPPEARPPAPEPGPRTPLDVGATPPAPASSLIGGNPLWFVALLIGLGALFLIVAVIISAIVSTRGTADRTQTVDALAKLLGAIGATFLILPFPGLDQTGCNVGLGGEPDVAAPARAAVDGLVPHPTFHVFASGAAALFLLVYAVLNLRQIGSFLGRAGKLLKDLRDYMTGGGGKNAGSS